MPFEHCVRTRDISRSSSLMLMWIPASLGGLTLPWSHPVIIGMIEGGLFIASLFVVYEGKIASIRVLRLHIFKIRSVGIIMIQTCLVGFIY